MFKPALILAGLLLLQGCAAAVVAGGATAVGSATDRRTLGSQIDDSGITIKARRALADDPVTSKGGNLSVASYNGVVLLTGQAMTEQV
ncbi:MAG: BON domain-containing protein, partial [Alishewanella aestuarii]